jgi:putative flippase GtrA
MSPKLWLNLPRQLRYLLVGGVNTAFGYGLFVLCYLTLSGNTSYPAILVLSHILAVTFSFATHNWLVFFEAPQRLAALAKAWCRFQFAYLGLLGLGLAINVLMLRHITTSVWLAQGVATTTGVIAGYVVHRTLVFNRSTPPPQS